MTYLINEKRVRRFHLHARLALVAAAALSGFLPRPVAAEPVVTDLQIVIPVSTDEIADPTSLTRIRRQFVAAAGALCDSGGIAAVHRNGAQRCRRQVIADAERQLQARIAPRLAAAEGR